MSGQMMKCINICYLTLFPQFLHLLKEVKYDIFHSVIMKVYKIYKTCL